MPKASATDLSEPPSSPERKLFSRESVMHMNDATKATLQPNAVKRTRSSKNSTILRRQSTPTELKIADNAGGDVTATSDSGGIVTASLQISMAFKRPTTTAATTTTTTKSSHETDNTKISGDQTSGKMLPVNTPPAPASITNIGGAILRSKTADFERINALNQQKQLQLHEHTQQQQQLQHTTSTTKSSVQQQQQQQQPLYKRQQLIRSAKTTFPK